MLGHHTVATLLCPHYNEILNLSLTVHRTSFIVHGLSYLLCLLTADEGKVAVDGVNKLSWLGQERTRSVQQGTGANCSWCEDRRKYVLCVSLSYQL